MYRFLETIKIKNNTICSIQLHNNRVNATRSNFFKSTDKWELEKQISLLSVNSPGTYKCRIIYGEKIESIEIIPYSLPNIKTIRMISDDTIDYSYKYLNRERLDILRKKASGTDDVLIIKNKLITDTSFANIVFFDGKQWITPLFPLLNGTKRQFYIEQKVIFERNIKVSDLSLFSSARIINAMIDLEESPDIEIKNIFPA